MNIGQQVYNFAKLILDFITSISEAIITIFGTNFETVIREIEWLNNTVIGDELIRLFGDWSLLTIAPMTLVALIFIKILVKLFPLDI